MILKTWFSRLFSRKSELTDIRSLIWSLGWGGFPSKTGYTITDELAMSVSAAYGAVRAISEDIGKVPLITYRRIGATGAKERATNHPLYRLLHDSPNEQQTAMEFREMQQAYLLLRGDAFAFKVMTSFGPEEGRSNISELLPIPYHQVRVERMQNGRLLYHVRLPDGSEERTFTSAEIWHLRGLSLNGYTGCTPIKMHAETIGSALAMQDHASIMFRNRGKPGIVLSHPGTLSPEAAARLRDSFAASISQDRLGATTVLEEGMTAAAVGFSNEDIQLIEQRKFSKGEFATIFRIPPHKIGDLERATFTNIEHQNLDYVIDTLMPWAVRWEKSILQNLIRAKDTYFCEFLFDALLRGDSTTRTRNYAVARQWGWLNVDEIRARENMNPLPDGAGQVYLQPMNMVDSAEEPDEPPDEDTDGDSQQSGKPRESGKPPVPPAKGRRVVYFKGV